MRFPGLPAAALVLAMVAVWPAAAQDREISLTIKDHQFVPAELTVPARTRLKLTIKNEDPTPAEFECPDLRREKVVPGGGEGIVYVGPLQPGTYEFFDDFRPETKGRLIAQ